MKDDRRSRKRATLEAEPVAGEEEAEGYVDPENNTPDPEYVDVDALPDEDAIKAPKGIDYLLEDGVLKVNTGLNGELSAWATVYAAEPEKTVEFKYNANGLRTQKKVTTKAVVDGVEQTTVETMDYTLHGKLITHLTKRTAVNGDAPTTEEMHFFYDEQSRPAMVDFNGASYTYVHNLQGDIIGIVDNAGSIVVRYGYDAWGKPTEVWVEDAPALESSLKTAYETICMLNPFRYRGYVWDDETGLYYLRSRYYNPGWGRFVNIDDILSNSKCIGKNNIFAYCSNIWISTNDADGLDAYWITDSSNVGGMGHTSLLVQEGDKWFYFYWGPEIDDPDKFAKACYVEVSISEDDVLKNINDASETTEYKGTYDSATLFEGDFSKTADYCRKLVKHVEETGTPTYGLADNNCMQVVAKAMKASYNFWEKEFWLFRQIVSVVVPNMARKIVEGFGKKTVTGPSGDKGITV